MTAIGATLRIRREGALRSRAARGDAAAFAAVYERHHQALYRYCCSILRHEEDAQDALQSTMTRAFAALQDESRDFELRPWLFRIAHNEAISILRRRRTTGELEDQPAYGELEDRVSEREELRLLQLDLADLPERQRAALVLRELNGLSHAEIGVVLEVSPAAVKQAIFEARSALFSCREGREMACHDIRRMLSDGDGRVLRGRGVRAHLRSCSDCRRFRADLDQRPQALRALAPPLPVGAAAALLAQLVGGGGTAAKLLACLAIAGGGTTLAVEMQSARRPPPAAATSTATAAPRPKPSPTNTPNPLPVVASAPAAEHESSPPAARTASPKAKRHHHAAKRKRSKPVKEAVAPAKTAAPAPSAEPAKRVEEKRVKPVKVKRVKAAKPVKTPKAEKTPNPDKAAKEEKETKPIPPGQAEKSEPDTRGEQEESGDRDQGDERDKSDDRGKRDEGEK